MLEIDFPTFTVLKRLSDEMFKPTLTSVVPAMFVNQIDWSSIIGAMTSYNEYNCFLFLPSADILCIQFGPRSDMTECGA